MKQTITLLISCCLLTFGCSADSTHVNKGINASVILKSIDKGKPLIISDKIIVDDLDFTLLEQNHAFSAAQMVTEVQTPVTFVGCIFMGKVTTTAQRNNKVYNATFYRNLTFEACDFRAEADFSNTTVYGPVNFSGAVFRENASFNNLTVMGREAYFTGVQADKRFSMQEASFAGNFDFFKSKMGGKASFQSSVFNGTSRFSASAFQGIADFSLTNFKNDALFTYCNFAGDFRMANTVAFGKTDLISCVFQQQLVITNAEFHSRVNFSKSQASGVFDLSGSLFLAGKPVMDEFKFAESHPPITIGTKFASTNLQEFNQDSPKP